MCLCAGNNILPRVKGRTILIKLRERMAVPSAGLHSQQSRKETKRVYRLRWNGQTLFPASAWAALPGRGHIEAAAGPPCLHADRIAPLGKNLTHPHRPGEPHLFQKEGVIPLLFFLITGLRHGAAAFKLSIPLGSKGRTPDSLSSDLAAQGKLFRRDKERPPRGYGKSAKSLAAQGVPCMAPPAAP